MCSRNLRRLSNSHLVILAKARHRVVSFGQVLCINKIRLLAQLGREGVGRFVEASSGQRIDRRFCSDQLDEHHTKHASNTVDLMLSLLLDQCHDATMPPGRSVLSVRCGSDNF